MASQNKKNKARNSMVYNGAEKNKGRRLKGFFYFTKAMRHEIKKGTRKIEEDVIDYEDII